MKPDKSLITRVVASLTADEALPIPVLASWDTEPKTHPYIVVSGDVSPGAHRDLKVVTLLIDLITNRDDTAEALRDEYALALEDHLESTAGVIALAMIADGWQTRVWNSEDSTSAPQEDRLWSDSVETRVVLMQI
jgi:hypothetical protein